MFRFVFDWLPWYTFSELTFFDPPKVYMSKMFELPGQPEKFISSGYRQEKPEKLISLIDQFYSGKIRIQKSVLYLRLSSTH